MAFKVLPDADLSQMITAGDMSGNVLGNPFNLRKRKNAAMQLEWIGSPVGVFAFQVSLNHVQDTEGNIQVLGTWDDLPMMTVSSGGVVTLGGMIAAVGAGDDAYIEFDGLSAPYIRVIYASVSGTGTLNAYVSAKGD